MTEARPKASHAFGPRLNKSCDICQARKIRCITPKGEESCQTCLKRGIECHFSIRKPAHRRNVAEQFLPPGRRVSARQSVAKQDDSSTSISSHEQKADGENQLVPEAVCPEPSTYPQAPRIPDIYVDRLLSQAAPNNTKGPDEPTFVPKNGIFGARHSLTFFSDSRLQSLARCLENTKVNNLVKRIESLINSRLRRNDYATAPQKRTQPLAAARSQHQMKLYGQLYFEHVHPMYPFLDLQTWEVTVSMPDFHQTLAQNRPWHCLYYTVLALGCQYAHGGSFEPGKGEAWSLFSLALAGFSDLLLLPDSLVTLQALTAMAVYGLGINALAIEHVIMSEATRRAQSMSKIHLSGQSANVYRKTFWMLYCLEKVTSFHFGRSSGFVDGDISCPIPAVPEASSAGFDWFLPLIRYARLISKAYTSLYSVGVSSNPHSYYLEVIEQLKGELETWRLSLPDVGFRPGGLCRPHSLLEPRSRSIALMFHYFYHSILLTLCRTSLWYLPTSGDQSALATRSSCQKRTLDSARAVLELTSLIEVEPYTQVCIVAGIPITALFVLFDMVIHTPNHEAQANLALLDMAAGHFSRIEYASGGSLPGSLISEFAHIAREYVNAVFRAHADTVAPSQAVVESALLASPVSTRTAKGRGSMSSTIGNDIMRLGSCEIPKAAQPDLATSQAPAVDPVDTAFLDPQMQMGMEYGVGTDVMDIFNYFLPDLDPMFYEGLG